MSCIPLRKCETTEGKVRVTQVQCLPPLKTGRRVRGETSTEATVPIVSCPFAAPVSVRWVRRRLPQESRPHRSPRLFLPDLTPSAEADPHLLPTLDNRKAARAFSAFSSYCVARSLESRLGILPGKEGRGVGICAQLRSPKCMIPTILPCEM